MTKRHKDFVLALSGGFAFFAIVHIARYGIELFSGAVANWPAGTILTKIMASTATTLTWLSWIFLVLVIFGAFINLRGSTEKHDGGRQ